jgi:hypothetical protein
MKCSSSTADLTTRTIHPCRQPAVWIDLNGDPCCRRHALPQDDLRDLRRMVRNLKRGKRLLQRAGGAR